MTYVKGYPVMVNSQEQHRLRGRRGAIRLGRLAPTRRWSWGARISAFMLQERPGAYILLGNGDTAMVHHPAYNFDDNAIPFGSSWYAGMVEARMPAERTA
ncbi:MAG: hypothetical protein U5N10_11175 [Gemmobacter sp.]|nr:hypothetical protein [Gemmobacter sp.]